MQQVSQESKENKGFLGSIGTVLAIVLCVLLIPILIFNSTLIIKSLIHRNEVPDFAGIRPFIVMTGSMEPTIMAGDLIVDKMVDPDKLKVGDVISFTDPDGNGVTVVTHRIVEITGQDGELAFRTRGDANNTEDKALVPASKVLGIYRHRIQGLGKVCMFMQTTAGLVVCVVVPLILFVLIDILRRRRYDRKKTDETEELKAEIERLKAELKEDNK